jgi:hypothetical protein
LVSVSRAFDLLNVSRRLQYRVAFPRSSPSTGAWDSNPYCANFKSAISVLRLVPPRTTYCRICRSLVSQNRHIRAASYRPMSARLSSKLSSVQFQFSSANRLRREGSARGYIPGRAKSGVETMEVTRMTCLGQSRPPAGAAPRPTPGRCCMRRTVAGSPGRSSPRGRRGHAHESDRKGRALGSAASTHSRTAGSSTQEQHEWSLSRLDVAGSETS